MQSLVIFFYILSLRDCEQGSPARERERLPFRTFPLQAPFNFYKRHLFHLLEGDRF